MSGRMVEFTLYRVKAKALADEWLLNADYEGRRVLVDAGDVRMVFDGKLYRELRFYSDKLDVVRVMEPYVLVKAMLRCGPPMDCFDEVPAGVSRPVEG